MSESAASSNIALLNLLAGLPKTLFGSKSAVTTSGGGSTTTSGFSQEALDALLKGILEGTSGNGASLASVAAGQKAPGLYNSTSKNLLMNDFSTRAAGEVAKAAAPKTVTTTPKTQITAVPGMGTGSLLGLGALALGSKKGKDTAKDLYKSVTDMFSDSSEIGAVNAGGLDSSGGMGESVMAGIPGSADFNLTALGSLFDGTQDGFAAMQAIDDAEALSGISNSIDSFSAAGSLFDGTQEGYAAMQAIDDAEALSGIDAAAGDSGFGLPAGTGKFLQGDYEGAAKSYALAAIPVVGPFLAVADGFSGGAVTNFLDNITEDLPDPLGVSDSVICTELVRQGLLCNYIRIVETQASKERYSQDTFNGYHHIATPVVKWMRKSSKLSSLLLPWAIDHGRFICYNQASWRNLVIEYILVPVCYLTGKLLGASNYKSLYTASGA